MANVTYLIGAGASAGKRGRDLPSGLSNDNRIIEGLPCVSEIATCLKEIVNILEGTKLPKKVEWVDELVGLNSKEDWEQAQKETLLQFKQLWEKCSEHSTIDTYAKKLRLRKDMHNLRKLEQLLSLFFMYLQMEYKPDSRYDNFLASILQENLHFPDNIHVLSWNYDSQFEIAYDEYNKGESLYFGSKRSQSIPSCVEVIKINGTASFDGQYNFVKMREQYIKELKSINPFIKSEYGRDPNPFPQQRKMMQLVFLYKLFITEQIDNTNLSFAFDNYAPTEALYERIDAIMENTNVLVVIGYTFPFFNREIDRRILSCFKPQGLVYIQDKYPNRIKQNFRAVKSTIPEGHIKLKEETEQFFLPPEL